MEKIEFKYDYEKLPPGWDGKQAQLLAVCPVNIDDQSMHFQYYDRKIRYVMEPWSPMPSGQYLLLCLLCDGGVFFTTLRKYNDENCTKYIGKVNEYFMLVKTK